eukprot:g4033.t1
MELPESEPAASDAADEAVADVPVEAEAVPDAKGEEAVPEAEAAPSGADVEAEVAEVAEVAEAAEGENEEPDELFEAWDDFHTLWLQGLSSYLLGIRETLQEVDDLAGSFSKDLVYIQRRFLEFLQRPDDKALVLDEFLRGFPLRRNDLTDKLWVHANHRKQESVEERQRLLTDGFWEEKANAHLQLSYKLQAGKTLQKRFKELEAAWGNFQWNQKSRSLNPTTREEVQAASAALAARPCGVDLEREVDSVLAELWDSLEKPAVKPDTQDPMIMEELNRLEAYIEARIKEEEIAEKEGREAKSRAKLEVCATQSEALGDMSARFQAAHPTGLDEGTGGTPMTSHTTQDEV